MRPLEVYSDVKIVMAETELFSLHLPELIARIGAFGQDFRARSLAACLFTSEDYVRASRERRAMIEEMQPLYRRFDLLVTANGSPAPRLDTHDPLAFWQRPNFNSTAPAARRLPCCAASRRTACRCRCRSPAGRTRMLSSCARAMPTRWRQASSSASRT
jgi:hypothetical protein